MSNLFDAPPAAALSAWKMPLNFPFAWSNPARPAGRFFAAHIAARHQIDKVLSFDMGGTTAKICLIKDQTPKTARVSRLRAAIGSKKGSGMPIFNSRN